MTKAWLALAVLLASAGSALALGEQVDILAVQAPAQTVAGHPFDATVELLNRGAARSVYLFAALYEGEASAPCGPVTDARFRAWTPTYQAVVQLPANARVEWPRAGDRWPQEYDAPHADGAGVDEWCVFVGEDGEASSIDWLDYESLRLRTRGTNAPPQVSVTTAPEAPRAGEDVRFAATGTDADGDAVTFSWDFGHANATGSKATGALVAHAFYPEGSYVVTVTASDGFATTTERIDVEVRPTGATEDAPAPTVVTQKDPTPLPLILAPLAALAAAALFRSKAPRDRSPRAPPRPPRE